MMVDVRTKPAIAFALALASVCCGHLPSRNARVDPSLGKFIPPDTTMLLDAHLDRLRNTAVYRKYADQLAPRQQVAGVTPDDVAEALVCSDGKNTEVFTRISRSDVGAKLRSSGRVLTHYNGADIYGDGKESFVLLEPDVAAAGALSSVKSVIDQSKRGEGGIPAALQPVLANLPAQDQIQAAMVGGIPGLEGITADNPNFGNLVRLAHSIESASLGVQADSDIRIHARADCHSEEDARQVHDALRGFIGLARLTAPANRPELVKIYDAINVTREKAVVNVTAQFAAQDLDALSGLLKNR